MDAPVRASAAGRDVAAAPPRNLSLQWLRGAAALMVLLYHASHYLNAERGDPRMLALFGGEFGLFGVAVFFAISGALMADALQRMPPASFLAHRIARIYPIYLIAALLLPPLLLGRFAADGRALSLVPLGPNGSWRLGVEWTLIFELFYYVLLFLLASAGSRRRIVGFAAIWLAAMAAVLPLLPWNIATTLLPTILTIVLNPANAAFAGGLLIPWLVRRGAFDPALAAVAAASALAIGPLLAHGALPVARLVGGFAAVAVVGLAVAMPARASAPSLFARVATALGNWSYGLYLVHVTVVILVYRHVDAPPLATWAIAIAAALLVSVPFGMADVRLYRTLRRRLDDADPAGLRRFAWIYVVAYAALGMAFAVKEILDPGG